MPQTSAVSMVIFLHSGQRCWCFFGREHGALSFDTRYSGVIFAFMFCYLSQTQRRRVVKVAPLLRREESNVNAKRGEFERLRDD
jgi:hypothetical protein